MPQADPKSSSGQEQQQTAQTVPYPSPYPQQFEDNTIDLYELWITLWNRKWLVIAVTLVAALGSIVYTLQLQRIYKAEALLLPPKAKDIQLLNVLEIQHSTAGEKNSNLIGTSADAVFSKFKQNLNSRTLHKKFIQEKGILELLAPDKTAETRNEDIYQGFAKLIKLREKNGVTSLSIELHDAEIAAQWVNDLIEFFDKETIAMLVEDLRNSIANQIRGIEYTISSKRQMSIVRREDVIREIENTITTKRKLANQGREDDIKNIENTISSKRQMAKLRREDKILQYEEAAVIASRLGLKDEVDTTNEVQNNQLNISTINIPLYNRGFKALQEEIQLLKNRESDDPYIEGLRDLQEKLALLQSRISDDPFIYGLRDLQEQLARLRSINSDDRDISGVRDLQEEITLLRSIKIEEEKMRTVHIDQAAYPAKSAIKPNRRSIVSLATVFGLFSGIFLAFFIEFVQNQREKHSE